MTPAYFLHPAQSLWTCVHSQHLWHFLPGSRWAGRHHHSTADPVLEGSWPSSASCVRLWEADRSLREAGMSGALPLCYPCLSAVLTASLGGAPPASSSLSRLQDGDWEARAEEPGQGPPQRKGRSQPTTGALPHSTVLCCPSPGNVAQITCEVVEA